MIINHSTFDTIHDTCEVIERSSSTTSVTNCHHLISMLSETMQVLPIYLTWDSKIHWNDLRVSSQRGFSHHDWVRRSVI